MVIYCSNISPKSLAECLSNGGSHTFKECYEHFTTLGCPYLESIEDINLRRDEVNEIMGLFFNYGLDVSFPRNMWVSEEEKERFRRVDSALLRGVIESYKTDGSIRTAGN